MYPPKMRKCPPKTPNLEKNCQKKLAANGKNIILPKQQKFGLHFTRDPKNVIQPSVVRSYLVPGLDSGRGTFVSPSIWRTFIIKEEATTQGNGGGGFSE